MYTHQSYESTSSSGYKSGYKSALLCTCIQIFIREESPEVLELDINSTLRMQVLRIQPLSWSEDGACVRLEVYGCLSKPGTVGGADV